MGFYDDDAAAALELIREFGTQLSIVRIVPADPATNDRPASKPMRVTAVCFGVILNPKVGRHGAADALAKGEQLIDSNRVLYIAGQGMTVTAVGGTFTGEFWPQADDRVQLQGRTFTVLGNDTLAPDGGLAIVHRTIVST